MREEPRFQAQMIARIDQGILEYKHCLVKELRGFLRARGIPLLHRNIKKEIISLLEANDREPRFSRFMSLPPELRCMIYRHAMSSLGYISISPFQFPTQPAITRVPRATREEALQVFYQIPGFTLQSDAWYDEDRYLLDLAEETEEFLRIVDPEYLGKAKAFALELGCQFRARAWVCITAQISTQTRTVTKLKQTLDVSAIPAGTRRAKKHAEAMDTIQSALKVFASLFESGLTGAAMSTWMMDTTAKVFPDDSGSLHTEGGIKIRLRLV